MVIKNAVLDIVCGVTSTLPDTGMPEVAFAGKSNVGKSSLINGLMNRKIRWLRPDHSSIHPHRVDHHRTGWHDKRIVRGDCQRHTDGMAASKADLLCLEITELDML